MKNQVLLVYFVLLCLSLLAPASHAAIVGQSATTSGQLQYSGFGDIGGGVGSGRYTLGSCQFASGTTTCTLSGTYVETAQSTRAPGASGSFAMLLTYPGNGPSPAVAQSIAAGSDVLQFSTLGSAAFTLTIFPTSGGQISGTYPAANDADAVNFSAFLDPGNFSCSGLSGGQPCKVGQVGLVPGATIVGGVKPFQFTIPQTSGPPSPANYQGLWYKAPAESEAGWGINFAHQGDVIFATWFTYDVNGKAWWLTMTATKTADGVYSGQLIRTNGAPFSAYVPPATTTIVGTGTLTFSSATTGTFAYTVNDGANVATQTKAIVLQTFGPVPTCVWGAQPDLTLATNYQDLWYRAPAESESGWGINFTQQGTTIFATWFTYDANRNPLWLSATLPQTAAKTYSGTLFLTGGQAFNAVPFDPNKITRTPVGTATLVFTNGNAGTFTYNVDLGDGVNKATQSKAIIRQVFRAPGTVCS